VAHVIQNLNFGGMERVLHNLARHLPEEGVDVHVVVLEYLGRFAEGLDDVATLHQVPPMSRVSLLHSKELTSVLSDIAPDIVHSHTGVWLKAARAARRARVPVVVHTEHGRPVPDRFTDRAIDGLASRHTDAVIAVSAALADVLRGRIVHDPSQVHLIANGVDVEKVRPPVDRGGLRAALGIPPVVPVIGSIGRLEPVKQYDLAIRAFARLGEVNRTGAPPVLILVGDGSERNALETLARTLGVSPRVHFLGWRTDAEAIYGAFDLFTLTSRSEGTSISLLEAMSSGVCPVVTDVGGNRAVLGQALEELLVPAGDAEGLAAAWERQLNDPVCRAALASSARERVISEFSLATMVKRHARLYRELLMGVSA